MKRNRNLLQMFAFLLWPVSLAGEVFKEICLKAISELQLFFFSQIRFLDKRVA